MPCTVLVAARSADGKKTPMLSHSYDHIGNVDFRLAKVPAAAPTPSRAVLRMEELDVPREVDSSGASGAVYAQLPGEDSVPIGEVPGPTSDTFGYLEAASGIINDAGVAIAECTCSAIFAALPVDKGGSALLNYAELTRIALERACTAREAIHTMGALAEEFGFFGNSGAEDLGGCAENLAVADTDEAWLFHILPDDTGASAIWAAQRVPDGHATCCANMFTIRRMELDDPHNFLYSASAVDVATRLGLWEPGTPFDFAQIYSHGEVAKYSGLRVWRALSLLAPSLQLSPHYSDLLLQPDALPFSVLAEAPVTREKFFSIMRDTLSGTEFDLSKGLAAGPFGVVDRYTGVNPVWVRPIGIYRQAYSYITETLPADNWSLKPTPLLWWGPHASVTTVYRPVFVASASVPASLCTGWYKNLDRGSAYWAHRYVKQTALMRWDTCMAVIKERQEEWEAKGVALIDQNGSFAMTERALNAVEMHAAALMDVWWALCDELV